MNYWMEEFIRQNEKEFMKEKTKLNKPAVSGSLPISQLGDFVDWIREIGFAKYKEGWCALGGSNGWHCSDEELIKMFNDRGQ